MYDEGPPVMGHHHESVDHLDLILASVYFPGAGTETNGNFTFAGVIPALNFPAGCSGLFNDTRNRVFVKWWCKYIKLCSLPVIEPVNFCLVPAEEVLKMSAAIPVI
jgi:hypothetical protein